MTEMTGRAAVITGAGSGIGMGLAKAVAQQGVPVALADINMDNAQRVVAAIEAANGTAIALHCDVCERDSIREMQAKAVEGLGPISLVFANAGATSFDPLMRMTDDDVDWIIQVNLMGVMNTVRAFLPEMIAGLGGHVVATASMAGLLPGWIPSHAPYSAAKMGIIGLMMNLSLELQPYSIHTTSYCPGGVASAMKANNALYRPTRFGGPGVGEVHVGEESFKNKQIDFYSPDSIAPMVLRAIKNNRAFVFDHAEQRRFFRETYSSIVEACYDDIDEYESQQGRPPANPDGARLTSVG